jgi:hypothetical protein
VNVGNQPSAVTQLAVFVENAPGRLAEITETLGEASINIRGFSVADTVDFGIVRLVVQDPEAAAGVLRDHGFAVHENAVLCVDVPDVPGGLAKVLAAFAQEGVNVEYMYSIVGTHICFAVEDVPGAARLLGERGISIVSQEELARV